MDISDATIERARTDILNIMAGLVALKDGDPVITSIIKDLVATKVQATATILQLMTMIVMALPPNVITEWAQEAGKDIATATPDEVRALIAKQGL